MDLSSLLHALRADPAMARVVARAHAGGSAGDPGGAKAVGDVGLGAPQALRPVVAAALAAEAPAGADRLVLAVTATDREAGDLAAALARGRPRDSIAE